MGQAKKVTIILNIQSAGDRSGGSHKVENFHPFVVSFDNAYSGFKSNRKGVNITKFARFSSDYSCNLSHIGEKYTALDQTRN